MEIKHFIRKAALKFCFRVYVPVLCMRKTSTIYGYIRGKMWQKIQDKTHGLDLHRAAASGDLI